MIIIGKADTAVKDWLGNRERFADLFNAIVYNGEDVIKPTDLTPQNNESGFMSKDKDDKITCISRRRDLIMNWNNNCNLVILAVESQVELNYAMPVRNMLYDALAYTDQMKAIWNTISKDNQPKKYSAEFFSRFRKTDKLYPVITLVLYYGGSEEWDQNLSLFDMFNDNITENQKEILRKYVVDYKINLIQLQKIQNLEVFKSDLRETIGMLQCRHDGNKLKKYVEDNEVALSGLDLESRRVIRDVMDIPNLEKYVKTKNGKEVVDMCKAVEDIKYEGIIEGKIEGKIETLINQISKKIRKGKSIDIIVEELDDEPDNIKPIYDAILECGIDESIESIYEKWLSITTNSH